MKEYGEQKFFVLIGDNAVNMQTAFKIILDPNGVFFFYQKKKKCALFLKKNAILCLFLKNVLPSKEWYV